MLDEFPPAIIWIAIFAWEMVRGQSLFVSAVAALFLCCSDNVCRMGPRRLGRPFRVKCRKHRVRVSGYYGKK
jgi:hypothetical protein